METITNIASTATTTVSNLIYGDQTKKNETDGKEPVSGLEGKGTVTEPFDQGNAATPLETADKNTFLDYSRNETATKEKAHEGQSDSNEFLKLNPTVDGPQNDAGAPKIHTNTADSTYTGMTIVPLDPDVAKSGPGTKSSSASEATGTADKTGVTDKLWKETPLDDISRSGAPGAGPTAPDPSIKIAAPDSITASSETYQGISTPSKAPVPHETDLFKESKVEHSLDGTVSPKTKTLADVDTTKSNTVGEVKGLAEEKPNRKSESSKPIEPVSSSTSEEKSSKMSHLKDKLKDKLHIGSKDK